MTQGSSLGQRIREIRTKKGLTQMELAAGVCTPSMISQIESGKAHPSFKMLLAIAERLEVPADHFLDGMEIGIEVRGKFAFAKRLVESGNYELALQLLNKLLEIDRPELTKEAVRLQVGICYRHTGCVDEAESILSDLVEKVPQDGLLLAQVMIELSATLQAKQEYQLATYHLLKVLDRLQAEPVADDPDLFARVVHQLAELYKLQGRGGKAIELYRKLVSMYLEQSDRKSVAHTYMTLAESYMNQGDYARSQECAFHAQAIFKELQNWARKTDAECQVVLLEWRQGVGQNTVGKLIEIAQTYVTQSEQEKAGAVYAEIAGVCLQEGHRKEALDYAEEARSLLSNEHTAKGNVYRLLATLFLEGGDDDKGYSYLLNAAVHFEHHRQFPELEEDTQTICSYLKDRERHTEALERMESYHAFVMQTISERSITL